MKGDFTRSTFDPKKRYSGVRLQQGRVGLDADFNEQAELDAFLRETALADVIGPCGVPMEDAEGEGGGGFRIDVTDEGDLAIARGHLYVEGLRVELTEDDATYLDQPDLPGAELPTDEEEGGGPGRYLVYVDAWRHHRTALEDESIREKALGGPDTATRLRTVGQVKVLRVRDRDEEFTCGTDSDLWDDLVHPDLGTLEARTRPGTTPDDPCVVPSDAGYTRLENQLYRVEVHDGGELGEATFKWSRENGSAVTAWLGQDEDELTVGTTGPDEVRGLAAGQWVELTDEDRELRGEAGLLVQILEVLGDETILIDPGGQTVDRTEFTNGPKLRRWDMTGDDGALVIETGDAEDDGYLPLEGGIEVHFGEGLYRTGDFWWIPARAFVGDGNGQIEWPADETDPTQPAALAPHGIEHHYCRLAVVDFDGESFVGEATDCRPRFPSLGELIRITPSGGDGQEGLPGELLPCPLGVVVANGRWPVEGARVRFRVRNGGGQVGGNDPGTFDVELVATTNQNGMARCNWILPGNALEPDDDCFAVAARLVDADDNPIDTPPVIFHATTALARRVAYEPGCDLLEELQAFTVQEALDELCRHLGGGPEEGVRVENVVLLANDDRLANDLTLPLSLLRRGVAIDLSEGIGDRFDGDDPLDPVLDLAAHWPLWIPDQSNDRRVLSGFSPLALAASVELVDDTRIRWVPRSGAILWLRQMLEQMRERGDAGDRLMIRLTLRGNFVWSADDENRFLDGDAFGEPRDGRIGLRLPSGDDRRGGDFRMWFWVREDQDVPEDDFDFTAVPVVFGNVRSIGGFLRDANGGGVPGVTVSLRSSSNPSFPTRTTVTNAQGGYTFANVPPGTYVASVRIPGGPNLGRQVTMPTSPNNPPFDPNNPIPPILGIGAVRGRRLVEAGIGNLGDLALAPPRRLAQVLDVSEDQARVFIGRAVARLRGEE